jgi:NAD-dependent dihydropyrimidine dehydrogenase PreA subunit
MKKNEYPEKKTRDAYECEEQCKHGVAQMKQTEKQRRGRIRQGIIEPLTKKKLLERGMQEMKEKNETHNCRITKTQMEGSCDIQSNSETIIQELKEKVKEPEQRLLW